MKLKGIFTVDPKRVPFHSEKGLTSKGSAVLVRLLAALTLCLLGSMSWGQDTPDKAGAASAPTSLSLESEPAGSERDPSPVESFDSMAACRSYRQGQTLNLDGVKAQRVESVPRVYSGFNNIEGPVWLDGALYYSNIGSRNDGQQVLTNQGTIWRMRPGEVPEVWLDDRLAGANGLAISPDGQLLAARQLDGSIVKINPVSKEITTLAGEYEDKRFNAPNDLAVAEDGTIYFTDPNWNTPSNVSPDTVQGGGQLGQVLPGQRVYRLSEGVVTALSVTEQVPALRDKPNGIALSLDGSKLYVAGAQGLWVFDLQHGWPVNPKQVLSSPVDGMGRDCAGNLYITTSRKLLRRADAQIVLVLDDSLNELGFIEVPGVQVVTNVAFGGEANKTLFITTLGTASTEEQPIFCGAEPCLPASIFTAELNIPGLPY